MIAINFKKEFADAVASGKKTQTIRRTNRFKVGDTLQLMSDERKLGEGVVEDIYKVAIYCKLIYKIVPRRKPMVALKEKQLNFFARRDGFKDFEAMKAFFVAQYGDLPFEGYLIEWKLKGGE